MNEFLFYVGIVLSVAFFILGIILFFTLKIPSVIRFLMKIPNERAVKAQNVKTTPVSTMQVVDKNGTGLLGDQTELLNMAGDFRTDLLNFDTDVLSFDTDLLDLENGCNYKGERNVIN